MWTDTPFVGEPAEDARMEFVEGKDAPLNEEVGTAEGKSSDGCVADGKSPVAAAADKDIDVSQLTERQALALEEMRAGFASTDDADLLRFLKARNYKAAKAAEMLARHLEWRAETYPSKHMPPPH